MFSENLPGDIALVAEAILIVAIIIFIIYLIRVLWNDDDTSKGIF